VSADLLYLAQVAVAGLGTGLIYGLIGVGFAIIFNVTALINLAQGEFSMMSAVMATWLYKRWGLGLLAASVLSVVTVTLVGVLFERICIGQRRVLSVQAAIIITLGAAIFFRGGAMVAWGKDPYSLPAFSGQGAVTVAGIAVPLQTLWIFAISGLLVLALWWFFNRTLFGWAMRACAQNQVGAAFIGIDVPLMVTLSFALSAALGAIAGIVIAPLTFVSYDGGLILGLKGFVAVVLGGTGTYLGAMIGGMLLGILESLSAGYISSTYKDAVAFAVLIIVLTLLPSGLLGAREDG
jgi:branched-chain amino acid transport system permease protein